MTLLRYLLMFAGIGLLAGAVLILAWDLYQILKPKKAPEPGDLPFGALPEPEVRWGVTRRLAVASVVPFLVALSIAVVPSGSAGVRVNQFAGARPATLYPGVHWTIPLIE